MVKKSTKYLKQAKEISVLQGAVKERNEEIQILTALCKNKDDELFALHKQLQSVMATLVNPPLILDQENTRSKLRQLEGQVLSMQKWGKQREEKMAVLKAQLLMASRALSQFLKPTA